jgi:hypothetical protein
MRSILLISVISFFVFSCRKPEGPSRMELLCNKQWEPTTARIDPSLPIWSYIDTTIIGYTHNLKEAVDSCYFDNIRIYFPDSTLIYDLQLTCDGETSSHALGSWYFNADESALTEADPDGASPVTYKIEELSETEMVLSEQVFLFNNIYTATYTYQVK